MLDSDGWTTIVRNKVAAKPLDTKSLPLTFHNTESKKNQPNVMSEVTFKKLIDGSFNVKNETDSDEEVREIVRFKTSEQSKQFLRFIAISKKIDVYDSLLKSNLGLELLVEAIRQNPEETLPFIRLFGNNELFASGPARMNCAIRLLAAIYRGNPIIFKSDFEKDQLFEVAWFLLVLLKNGCEIMDATVGQFLETIENDETCYRIASLIRSEVTTPNMCQSPFFQTMDSIRLNHPGKMFDNDMAKFREIAIYPTVEEILFQGRPFLPQTTAMFQHTPSIDEYLDWAFRMLRHDMIYQVKEELRLLLLEPSEQQAKLNAAESKALKRLEKATAHCIQFGEIQFEKRSLVAPMYYDPKCSVQVKDRSILAIMDETRANRKPRLYCLVEVKKSSWQQSASPINVACDVAFCKFLYHIYPQCKTLRAVRLSCFFSAYVPVLKCLQRLTTLPFPEELLSNCPPLQYLPSYMNPVENGQSNFEKLVDTIAQTNDRANLASLLSVNKKTMILDPSQKKAIVESLRNRVALIQGPPGTGKSFCGAILANLILANSNCQIMCVCETNHALDQFLTDLLEFGAQWDDIVRLGSSSKIDDKMKQFTIDAILGNNYVPAKFTKEGTRILNEMDSLKEQIWDLMDEVDHIWESKAWELFEPIVRADQSLFQAFSDSPNPAAYWSLWLAGLRRPRAPPDLMMLNKNQKRRAKKRAQKAAAEGKEPVGELWEMHPWERIELVDRWRDELLVSTYDSLYQAIAEYEKLSDQLFRIEKRSKVVQLLKNSRVIGCTTSGAAIYGKELEQIQPEVVIVEEAGEILETHIISALSSNCQHLIMIGDHKQLRPKVECYDLQEESRQPYEFNRSLFERLVLKGAPHVTLEEQHRMRPEFSRLVKAMTYPNLRDAPKTLGRPKLKGVSSDLIFINHEHPESGIENGLSKRNMHEVYMVVQIAQHFLRVGYSHEDIVILTPYLGQMQEIRSALQRVCNLQAEISERDVTLMIKNNEYEFNPNTNMSPSRAIRVATVDNFQGEESKIIIASLVRSNEDGVVGFVGEPERLNVLLSRAREGMIILGNMKTFENAKSSSARKLWAKLLSLLSDTRSIFPGFPVHCEIHNRQLLCVTSAEFKKLSKDGGCDAQCCLAMPCGIHTCPRQCHGERDHDAQKCEAHLKVHCPAYDDHLLEVPCCMSQDLEYVHKKCSKLVEVQCNHGHVSQVSCLRSKDLEFIQQNCTVPVIVQCSNNGHEFRAPCCKARSPFYLKKNCPELVLVKCLTNGHVFSIDCPSSLDEWKLVNNCPEMVNVLCPYGHNFQIPCQTSKKAEQIAETCGTRVQVTCSKGHSYLAKCVDSRNQSQIDRNCMGFVNMKCSNGHDVNEIRCHGADIAIADSMCRASSVLQCPNGHDVRVPCKKIRDFAFVAAGCHQLMQAKCPDRGHDLLVPCCKITGLNPTQYLAKTCKVVIEVPCPSNHLVKLQCCNAGSAESMCMAIVTVPIGCPSNHVLEFECRYSRSSRIDAKKCRGYDYKTCEFGHTTAIPCVISNQPKFSFSCQQKRVVACRLFPEIHKYEIQCSADVANFHCPHKAAVTCRNGHLLEQVDCWFFTNAHDLGYEECDTGRYYSCFRAYLETVIEENKMFMERASELLPSISLVMPQKHEPINEPARQSKKRSKRKK